MTLDKKLSIFGATRANIKASTSLTIAIEGEDKAGKSHFWMTAPGPILVIDLDRRMNDTIQEFQKSKQIYVIQPEVNRDAIIKAKMVSQNERSKGATKITDPSWLKEIKKAWNDTVDAIEVAGKSGEVRTIAIDTADEWWELCRLASFGGRLDRIQPMEYGPVNMEFEKAVRMARKYGMNMVLTHKVKAEYKTTKGDKPQSIATGNMIRAGYAKTGNLCDLSIQLSYDKKEKDYVARVLKCGFGSEWVDEEFCYNEELDIDEVQFPFIAAAVTSGEEDLEEAREMAAVGMEEWS